MSNLKIIPFDKKLIKDFQYDGVEKDLVFVNISDIADFYASLGQAFIGMIDDKIIGIGGVYPLWKNWGSAWLYLNKEAKKHKLSLFKGIVKEMNELANLYNIKVLSVQCMNDSKEANNLLSHLNFVKSKEIKMVLYGRRL